MAWMPDGWVITVETDRKEVRIRESRELIFCKNCDHSYFASNRVPDEQCLVCDKHGIDVTDDWYCADGERRNDIADGKTR